MTEEIWEPVVGYEGLYEVSNQGQVRSLDHVDSLGRSKHGRILRQAKDGGGYALVCLHRGHQRGYNESTHRLVAEAFLGPCPPEATVHHIDGSRDNSVLENLCYRKPAEHYACAPGEGHWGCKLTEEHVRTMRQRHEAGKQSCSELARQFGVSYHTVYAVISGRTWKHVEG